MNQSFISVLLLTVSLSWTSVNGDLDTDFIYINQAEQKFPQVQGFQWVPQLDGSMKLMSDKEIEQILANNDSSLFYNPSNDMKFTLYVKNDVPRVIKIGDKEALLSSRFDPKGKTYILTHGYNSHGNDFSTAEPRK